MRLILQSKLLCPMLLHRAWAGDLASTAHPRRTDDFPPNLEQTDCALTGSAPAVERRHPVDGHINERRREVQCRVAERELGGECESGGHCCAPTSSANSSSMVSISSRH